LLTVNGKPHSLPDPPTVAGLIAALGLDPAVLVAELNGAVVQGPDFAAEPLADGDHLELVTFVGGG
jgi:sulfur carrier protein